MSKKENMSKRSLTDKLIKDLKMLDKNSAIEKINKIDDLELLKVAIDECKDLQMESGIKYRSSPERQMVDFIKSNLQERAILIENSTLHNSEATITKGDPLNVEVKKMGKFNTDESKASAKLNSQATEFVQELQGLDEKSISSKIKTLEDVKFLKKAIDVCAISRMELGIRGKTKPKGKKISFITSSLMERMKEIENPNINASKKVY